MTPHAADQTRTDNATDTWSYADFAERARQLLVPLAALMRPGESHLPIEGAPSNHGEAADRFEAFARPCLLAALWLRSTGHASPEEPVPDPDHLAAWFREGLVLGTDPSSEKFWGVLPSFHQFAVEMAILVMALDIAQESLWAPLSSGEKQQVADWLAQIRGHAGHHNNHLFFDLLTLEFLVAHGFGTPEDHACIDWLFAELETMHREDGWFIDGTNETYDHYNAYAFHIYGLYWAWRYGAQNAGRAERWKSWAARFLPDYARFFAASGEPIPFGRSLTYRFNGAGVFPLAALLGIDSVEPGTMRRICRRCIEFFLSRPVEQSQGCLSIGWTDEFQGVAEPYSCAGSPYWAAKGLLMLLLDPDDPFFTAEERPMPSETDAPPTVIRAPGLVVRNIPAQRTAGGGGAPTLSGEVELINAGGWSSFSAAARFGQWKWGRVAYRTGVGSLYPESPDIIPPDAGLTACRAPVGPWFGRHKTIPLAVSEEHAGASYTLSAPASGFNVSVVTRVWWRDGALFQRHTVRSYQRCIIRTGGFAIADAPSHAEATDGPTATAIVSTADQSSTIRSVSGWTDGVVLGSNASTPRLHLYGPGWSVPVLQAEIGVGVHRFAEVLWTGGQLAQDPCWAPLELRDDRASLSSPSRGSWNATLPEINEIGGA
jgi:hypothetical protein